MSSAVQVVIRTRPTAAFAADQIIVDPDGRSLSIRMPKSANPNAQDSWSWKYDGVLHNASIASAEAASVGPSSALGPALTGMLLARGPREALISTLLRASKTEKRT